MSKQGKDKVQEEVVYADLPAPREVALPIPTAVVKKYNFEQWCSRAGVKEQHKSGLRSFVKNIDKPRTLNEWDEIYKSY